MSARRWWRAAVVAGACCTSIGGRAAGAGDPPARLYGTDRALWLVHRGGDIDPTSKLPVVRLLTTDRIDKTSGIQLWRELPSLVGALENAAAKSDGMILAFADGSLTQVTLRGATPVARLPAHLAVMALCGDVIQSQAAALVHRMPDLLPRASAAASAPIDIQSEYGLITLKDGAWRRLAAVPREIAAHEDISMIGRDGRLLLWWIEPDEATDDSDEGRAAATPPASQSGRAVDPWRRVQAVEWSESHWSDVATVWRGAGLTHVWMDWEGARPVAVAAEAMESSGWRLRLLARDGEKWNDLGLLQEAAGGIVAADAAWSAVTTRGLWAFARPTKDGQVQVGVSEIGSDPRIRWSAASSRPQSTPTPWTAWVSTLAICAMLAFLITLRPERLSTPPRLPPDLVPAMPARRVAATLLDLIPAVLATAYWWGPLLKEWLSGATRPALEDVTGSTQFLRHTQQAWLLCLAVFALYCLLWELLMHTTPGKYLFGMRVLPEEGGKLTAGQFVIRNGMRVAELLDPFVATCSLFVMLVLSQRRQRIGDLLARTMVVGPAPLVPGGPPRGPTAPPGRGPDESADQPPRGGAA